MKNDTHTIGKLARRMRNYLWTIPLGLRLAWFLLPVLILGYFLAVYLLIDHLICTSDEGRSGMNCDLGQRHRSVDDLCQGDIDRASFSQRQQRYDEALAVVPGCLGVGRRKT